MKEGNTLLVKTRKDALAEEVHVLYNRSHVQVCPLCHLNRHRSVTLPVELALCCPPQTPVEPAQCHLPQTLVCHTTC